jgi:o-succinylbenzoate synthase
VITGIRFHPYRLGLRRPWRSARGSEGVRSGWLVRCEVDGLTGHGDCAPLPAAGTEDGSLAWNWLCAWRGRAVGQSVGAALYDLDWEGPHAPAARYAAECALADLAAQAAGLPLFRWLEPGLSAEACRFVPVNATLGPLAELRAGDLTACAAEGYRVFKVKVGLDGLEADLHRLAELAPHLPPRGQFRLDANGAWTPAEAGRAIAALNTLPVEALEEPLGDPVPADLRRLQVRAAFPLALDESLILGSGWRYPAAAPVRRLVLKPAVLGGLQRTLTLARAAQAAGVEVVVTSLIESAAGLWPTLHLAAAVDSAIPHGLATAGWLARDLGEAPRPRAGRIAIPQAPGGGFRPG